MLDESTDSVGYFRLVREATNRNREYAANSAHLSHVHIHLFASPMSNATAPQLELFRRVVTGIDEAGQSTVIYDDSKGHILDAPNGVRFQTLWLTDTVPADCSTNTQTDPTLHKGFDVANVEGASVVYVTLPAGVSVPKHKTPSIDFGVVIKGEVELIMESGSPILLKTGRDVVVQRETQHAWYNPHPTDPAIVFFSVVASKQ
ncbi:hypothetical protein Clacol_001308 [Clathrus columnatus]|uniref:Cupin type-2 domain-containing protein n=1 Tax=Clathrus columnatus TaxID=1419009 RepID=A0AAV5A3A1_9AGAM|nr:hypothetical protein Clacol_001308 [Clathrus columnatus]